MASAFFKMKVGTNLMLQFGYVTAGVYSKEEYFEYFCTFMFSMKEVEGGPKILILILKRRQGTYMTRKGVAKKYDIGKNFNDNTHFWDKGVFKGFTQYVIISK